MLTYIVFPLPLKAFISERVLFHERRCKALLPAEPGLDGAGRGKRNCSFCSSKREAERKRFAFAVPPSARNSSSISFQIDGIRIANVLCERRIPDQTIAGTTRLGGRWP